MERPSNVRSGQTQVVGGDNNGSAWYLQQAIESLFDQSRAIMWATFETEADVDDCWATEFSCLIEHILNSFK
jgi:hypothetical protein